MYVLEEIDYMIRKLPEWAADEPVEKTPHTQQEFRLLFTHLVRT